MKDEMEAWLFAATGIVICVGVIWFGESLDHEKKRKAQETLDRITADTKGTGIYHLTGGEVSCAWVGGVNVGSCWPHQLELCPRLEPLE